MDIPAKKFRKKSYVDIHVIKQQDSCYVYHIEITKNEICKKGGEKSYVMIHVIKNDMDSNSNINYRIFPTSKP